MTSYAGIGDSVMSTISLARWAKSAGRFGLAMAGA